MAKVASAADQLAALSVEGLGDDEVERLLSGLGRPLRQLEGVRARAAAVSQSRALAQAGGSASGATVREHQRRLATEQQLTPSEVKEQIEAGRAVRDNPATAHAVATGEVGPRYAKRIAQVLRELHLERREAVERELIELAARMDALAFGREVRRILARERPQALAKDERRRHLDRSLRATDTEDGGFAFSGLLYGVAAEQARVALNAFRRPDTPDEVRTPQQRGADAFEQLCAVALRSGTAPTVHGERPQVMVVFTAEQHAALSRAPELTSGVLSGSGITVSGREVRNLVADCELFRVVLGADGVPMEVSTTVRTVPIGLWRALLLRDGGCVWDGCDAPASWCDVAHGEHAFTKGGRLSLDNAMLLCRSHHRRFDHGPYKVTIDGTQVTITRSKGQVAPEAPASPGSGGGPEVGAGSSPRQGSEVRSDPVSPDGADRERGRVPPPPVTRGEQPSLRFDPPGDEGSVRSRSP